jgi:hypothetical protein
MIFLSALLCCRGLLFGWHNGLCVIVFVVVVVITIVVVGGMRHPWRHCSPFPALDCICTFYSTHSSDIHTLVCMYLKAMLTVDPDTLPVRIDLIFSGVVLIS